MLKTAVKSLMQLTPFRVTRARDANRFQAMDECLASLANRGFAPQLVIDGGANVGDFARRAASFFPKATVHLVEPQPACQKHLSQLAQNPRFLLHGVALGAEDSFIDFAVDPSGVTTGAHVLTEAVQSKENNCIRVPMSRLDTIFGTAITNNARCILKLDLQGWELEALKGSERIINQIEVVLLEVSFFAQSYEPSIESLFQFLHKHDYALYDIASISARSRDNRARQGDFVFVRRDSPLMADSAWA